MILLRNLSTDQTKGKKRKSKRKKAVPTGNCTAKGALRLGKTVIKVRNGGRFSQVYA